jgi:hypothetical protein
MTANDLEPGTVKCSMSPVTASALSSIWLRVTGKDRWTSTPATVFSYACTSLASQADSSVGHHHVVYSYSVASERYSGEFVDYGTQEEEYLKPNDTLAIKYDPRHPSRSYYPELRTRRNLAVICFSIGLALALLVFLVNFLARAS